ncbi:hypothetical protein EPN44_14350 [bacterium]|nr:MAG: hypothetical protein EPN44_14350 [bacterium]
MLAALERRGGAGEVRLRELAAEVGVTALSCVCASLRELREAGLVRGVRRGRNLPNLYEIVERDSAA